VRIKANFYVDTTVGKAEEGFILGTQNYVVSNVTKAV
jgi:hypothetical protein